MISFELQIILARLSRAQSVEQVRAALAALDERLGEPIYPKEIAEEVEHGFERLRELTADAPGETARALTDDLLPRCLAPDAPNDGDPWAKRARLHVAFGEWLVALAEDVRVRVRQVAVARAVERLHSDGVHNALRLLSSIGFWDSSVIDSLDNLIDVQKDSAGDHALSVRVRLRLDADPAARAVHLRALHRRIPEGPHLYRINSAGMIGTPETAELMNEYWLPSDRGLLASQHPDLYLSLTLNALSEIAARVIRSDFSEQVWGWVTNLASAWPRAAKSDVALNGPLSSRLDTPAVVVDLVNRSSGVEGHLRFLYRLRALECARPGQLLGWNLTSRAALASARADATAATGMTGRFMTTQLSGKEAAWDVLLCHGDPGQLPPLGEVLAGETSGYVLNRLLDLASCLPLDALPAEISGLLSGSPERADWSHDERLVAQVAAIRAVHGSAGRVAFDALMGYSVIGGGVLLSLVDALAAAADVVARAGDRSLVDRLFVTAEAAPEKDCRAAASAAVAKLIEADRLEPEELVRAALLPTRSTCDEYARRELLLAFAAHPVAPPPAVVEYAKELLDSTPTGEWHDPRPAAIALLALLPGTRRDPDFLATWLELAEGPDGVEAGPEVEKGLTPYVLGRYFVAEPRWFASAVATLLYTGNAASLAHLLPAVRAVGRGIPPLVADALVARVRRADTGRLADSPVLAVLGAVAPDRLVFDACTRVDAWMPQARSELADVLGRTDPADNTLSTGRLALLVRLAGDGVYAVRRAAYRAAARVETTNWIEQLREWARGGEGLRRRAAEAAGWFSREAQAPEVLGLGSDPEPTVREAYRGSLTQQQERALATAHLPHVLAARDPEDVVRNWRYGVALGRLGDDATIEAIDAHLGRTEDDTAVGVGGVGPDLAPSVRFWLERVRKTVRRRWDGVTRDWPEPWYTRRGHLEEFLGRLRSEDGQEFELKGTLWSLPADSPGGVSSWGGWAVGRVQLNDEGELLIPGRRPARVLVLQSVIPSGRLLLNGTGIYPFPI